MCYYNHALERERQKNFLKGGTVMSIQKWIEQQKKEGNFQMDVVYANIGNNTDELILCTAKRSR